MLREGAGSFGYSLVTAANRIFNFTTGAFEAFPAAPAAAHVRPMTATTFGPSAWSQDVTPAIPHQPVQMFALIFALDAAGKPLAFDSIAMLTPGTFTGVSIYTGR